MRTGERVYLVVEEVMEAGRVVIKVAYKGEGSGTGGLGR